MSFMDILNTIQRVAEIGGDVLAVINKARGAIGADGKVSADAYVDLCQMADGEVAKAQARAKEAAT